MKTAGIWLSTVGNCGRCRRPLPRREALPGNLCPACDQRIWDSALTFAELMQVVMDSRGGGSTAAAAGGPAGPWAAVA